MLPKLQWSEERALLAAEGWLGLGDWREASKELDALSSEQQNHPLVLCLRWQIGAAANEWERAAELARQISVLMPEDCFGWVHWAYALHELKRTREAYSVVASVIADFPEDTTMRYNLACYACQLGELPEALEWLKLAKTLVGEKEVRAMALADKDLEPLWGRI